MRKTVYLAMVLATMASVATDTASLLGEARSKAASEDVPKSVSSYVHEQLPGLSILKKESTSSDVVRYLTMKKVKQSSPFMCSGDFNGDGLKDVALLLKDEARKGFTLLVLHRTDKHSFRHVVVEELADITEPDQKIHLYLLCEKPGMRRQVEGAVLRTTNDSITLGYYGKASSLYYWGKTSYMKVVIGD